MSPSGADEREPRSVPPGGAEGGAPPDPIAAAAAAEACAARADDELDKVLAHRDTPVPSLDELRAALQWAFEKEEVEPALLDRFAEHARFVLTGNQSMNLTAIVAPREVAAKHYLDCWRATRLLPLMGRKLLDLGTGAGFPGIPIALSEPHASVTCLDSARKRADFVGTSIAALGLRNANAVWARGEEHLARNKYDLVFIRALSSVRENVRLLRKVRHALKDLLLFKGPSWSREVRAGEREAERLGFKLDTVWEHELPGEMGQRALLVYRAPGAQGER
ncbi:MAG: 16S rRNA (guanine(527)-N(7))-methyltransferase RsmG [Planctomycetota bacterium]|nr:MAG: 16S rRNA (guanine(527)-N(7))-methyltransferase RsmG [Planctomycetota bacterium]